MRSDLTLLSAGLLGLLLACESPPSTTEPTPGLSASRGGIPGPPAGIILPPHVGPPPGIPAPPGAGPPSFLLDWVSLGAGSSYSCGLRSDGSVLCWGANNFGQLGNGTQVASSTPVPVSGGLRFTQMAVGDIHTCAIDSGGALYCWGSNAEGQLGGGLPTGLANFSVTPIAVLGGRSFVSVSAGLRSTCGIATDGATYCWGLNGNGQLGNGTIGGNQAVPGAVLNSSTLGFQLVTTGFLASCARTGAGDLYCWGANLFPGLFGNGAPTPPLNSATPVPAGNGLTFLTVDAGSLYSCGLAVNGAARCWGNNVVGELGLGSTAPTGVPSPVAEGLTFAQLDANSSNNILAHTCGVTTGRDAYCWGSNRIGQLGATGAATCTFGTIGAFNCSLSPVAVGGNIQFRSVAVGNEHTCGVALDGAGYCWGRNTSGQLGDGTVTDRPLPTLVRAPLAREVDTDGDGIPDVRDSCPLDPGNDADGDGVCGNA